MDRRNAVWFAVFILMIMVSSSTGYQQFGPQIDSDEFSKRFGASYSPFSTALATLQKQIKEKPTNMMEGHGSNTVNNNGNHHHHHHHPLHSAQRMCKESETDTPELPVSGHQHITVDEDEALIMDSFSSNNSCCSFFPCFGSQPSTARSYGLAGSSSSPSMWERLQQTAEINNNWWAGPLKGLKKVREWSEIIAGPRWKNFIRSFNRAGKPVNGSAKLNYDPLSYALNFDDGPGQNGHLGEDSDFPDFSSRFASISLSCKSSMDLGKHGFQSPSS